MQFQRPNVVVVFFNRLLKVLWAHVVRLTGGGVNEIDAPPHRHICVHTCTPVKTSILLLILGLISVVGSETISNETDYLNPASSIPPSRGVERGH